MTAQANIQQDEVFLEQLFDETTDLTDLINVLDGQGSTAQATEASIDGAALSIEDLQLDASLVEEVATQTEVKTEQVATEPQDTLEGLIEDTDFDASALDLSLAVTEVSTEEKKVEKKSKKTKKETEAAKNQENQREASPSTYRTTYQNSKVSAVLLSRLGDDAYDHLLLEVEDAELLEKDPEALKARQQELLNILNARPGSGSSITTQKKVAEKIVQLFTWLKNGGELNVVMHRTFGVLLKDGYITTKKTGNLYSNLLAKPYSPGTASAQSGQMMQMLPMLKIALKDEQGRLVPNPNSLLLMKIKSELFPEL
ncbi:hypothetical protein ACLMPH_002006 [Acinetobacter baumannii]